MNDQLNPTPAIQTPPNDLLGIFLAELQRNMPARACRALVQSFPLAEMRAKDGFAASLRGVAIEKVAPKIMETIHAECRDLPAVKEAGLSCPFAELRVQAVNETNWTVLDNWLETRTYDEPNQTGPWLLRDQIARTIRLKEELVCAGQAGESTHERDVAVVRNVAALIGVLADLLQGIRRREIADRSSLGRLLARLRNEEVEWPWLRGGLINLTVDAIVGAPKKYLPCPTAPRRGVSMTW